MKSIFFILIMSLPISSLHSQKDDAWDDTKSKDWPVSCKKIDIISTSNDKIQNAYSYKSVGDKPRPLIVSLHTWSYNYELQDSLSWQSIEKNYNYIHPDLRGPNYTFEACGSELVISDIDDAIAYAIKNGNVDTDNIHIIGVSGGGYATFLAYREFSGSNKDFISKREIHYKRKYNETVQLILFEGGHEMLLDVALNNIKSND